MIQRRISTILMALFLMGFIVLAFTQFCLPEALPVDAPASQFSAGRALEYLDPLVRQPHPAGSSELADVRESLIGHLQTLGFEVDVQATTGTLPRCNVAGQVDNIVARLPGSNSTGALLLIAHYDSVPQGPGAGDNGSGVVTLLETLRALQGELPLKNDIIVLYTDAEEYGTLGAQAFAAQHPWMDEVSVVLNIEGTLHGSVVLVETGPENGWFVRNFRSASSHALGYAWLYDLFGLMLNLTDFMPFREAGLAGGNLFAFNGGSQYHTPRDTIANMDTRSLQQHGEQTLSLVRHFGMADLTNPHAPDVVYFNIYKNWMVIYPAGWALPLNILVVMLIVLTLSWALCRRRMSVKKLVLGMLVAFADLVAGPMIVMLLWSLIQQIHPQYSLYFPAHTHNDVWYATAFAALTAAVSLALFNLLRRWFSWRDLLGGALVLLGLINLPVSILAPGFSYLLTWPLLFGLLPLWILRADDQIPSWLTTVVLAFVTLTSILLWAPAGAILYWSSGLDFLPAISVAVVIPLILATSQIEVIHRSCRWALFSLLTVGALVGLIGGMLTSDFNAERPMPLRVQYFLNADKAEAFWINPVTPLSDWQIQFTAGGVEEISWEKIFQPFHSTILRSPAPVLSLDESQVSVLSDVNNGDERFIILQIKPARQSDQIILAVPPEVSLVSSEVDGQSWMETPMGEVNPSENWQTFYYVAAPETGIEVTLAFQSPGPDRLLLAERSVGLDSVPGLDLATRPEAIISLGDYVFVSQTIQLKSSELP